jgi:hypothetical protein
MGCVKAVVCSSYVPQNMEVPYTVLYDCIMDAMCHMSGDTNYISLLMKGLNLKCNTLLGIRPTELMLP